SLLSAKAISSISRAGAGLSSFKSIVACDATISLLIFGPLLNLGRRTPENRFENRFTSAALQVALSPCPHIRLIGMNYEESKLTGVKVILSLLVINRKTPMK